MQKFLKLKELARNSVGEGNEIFVSQLNSLMALYKQAAQEVDSLEGQILSLIEEINPKSLTSTFKIINFCMDKINTTMN
ncbi:MAG: hypothetical protein AAGU76_10285 [Sedimentibacter sp.]|uniref:hypothetical protein n=1 Tax=Sedimentibacter sp. TaxID=1960295 RepID=UPI003158A8EF